jgi:hypothetical protein
VNNSNTNSTFDFQDSNFNLRSAATTPLTACRGGSSPSPDLFQLVDRRRYTDGTLLGKSELIYYLQETTKL